ncbi:MAG: BlaI/MecI/CopY family transcriptional regulator [Planctomycetaceae bacterium]
MADSDQLPPLSEAQFEIMSVVWSRGETTVGEIWAELSQRRRMVRNTIQTMVVRLEEKGWLRHRVEGNTFHYTATQPAQEVRRRVVRRMVDTVFEGSTEGLLLALLEEQNLSAEEAERIRGLIDQATRGTP